MISSGRLLFLATVAFFVVGIGPAFGSYLVTSNSQVGPGTISGHRPPPGDHANLIAGTVNGTDLATGAVTRGKLAANSVNGAKVEDAGIKAGDLAASVRLPTGCGSTQVAKWNGSAWACAQDESSGGTVTSVGSGIGLTGGPITGAGSLSLVPSFQLPQNCTPGQVVESTGSRPSTWTCANDQTGSDWSLSGNSGTTASSFLGTTDNQPLNLKVNGSRALRIEPTPSDPNLIGGDSGNSVTSGAVGATIGGGGDSASDAQNKVTDSFGTVAGGWRNQAGDNAGTQSDREYAAVGGGTGNTASGDGSAVAGGLGNHASGEWSSVTGGGLNTASGQASTVAGGVLNHADGVASLAAGFAANAPDNGSFVWGDESTGSSTTDTGANSFVARASGGVTFYTAPGADTTHGVTLAPNSGSWSSLSDRHAKTDVARVSGKSLLRKLRRLPIDTWRYKGQARRVRHLGPMAQAFHRAFGLGESRRYIDDVDAQGVALGGVRALANRYARQHRALQATQRANRRQNRRIRSQARRIAALERAVKRLQRR